MNVIVTGANGFVGSAVCRYFAAKGHNVTAVVRSEESDVRLLCGIAPLDFLYCELSEIKDLAAMSSRKYDIFYHFAWEGTSGGLRADTNIQLDNVRYSCDAVKTAHSLGCSKFIMAGSIMAYEVARLKESLEDMTSSCMYSTAKMTADYMAQIVANDLGISYMTGLISNIYGPGERSQRLINTSIRKLINHEETEFSEGNQLYDFIYIDDAAEMFYEIGVHGLPNRSYYIGSARPRPLKDFLSMLGEEVAPGVDIGIGRRKFEGVSLTYDEFDIGLTERELGAMAKVDFREGIRRTRAWIKSEER